MSWIVALYVCTSLTMKCDKMAVPFKTEVECNTYIKEIPNLPSVKSGEIFFLPLRDKLEIYCHINK